MIHNKLVRDKIIEFLSSQGISSQTKILDDKEYALALNAKLQEEVLEYLCAKAKPDQLEELSDIMEVILAILNHNDLTFSDLEAIRKTKLEKRGGFIKRIFLEETTSPNHISQELSDCIFCQMSKQEKKAEIVAKFAHCFAIKDQMPVSAGHILLIPYEHSENWFSAREEIRLDIVQALNFMKTRLDWEYKPDGYNIGVNCGMTAGQTIMHLHVHLIPRYKGDMHNPKGGVRGVIPSKQKY